MSLRVTCPSLALAFGMAARAGTVRIRLAEAEVRAFLFGRFFHAAFAGVFEPFLLRKVSTFRPVSAEWFPVWQASTFLLASLTVLFRHDFHRLGPQRLKPGEMLANLFRPFLTRDAREKFPAPGTDLHREVSPCPRRAEEPRQGRETGNRSSCRAENFTLRPLNGLDIEPLVFDMQNQVLDMARSFDVERFLVGHRHRGAVVLDAAHLSAFDALRLVIGQAIALPHPAIVHAKLEAAFKLNRVRR